MACKSTIDRLPHGQRSMLARMRSEGESISAIHAALLADGAKVSRSAVGRHTKKLDQVQPLSIGAQLADLRRQVRQLAERLDALCATIRDLNTSASAGTTARFHRVGAPAPRSRHNLGG